MVSMTAGIAWAVPSAPDNAPAWWDEPEDQYKRNGGAAFSVENTDGGDPSGVFSYFLENADDVTRYKECYLVLEWEVLANAGAPVVVTNPVEIQWPGGGPSPMNLVSSKTIGTVEHLEYSFLIDPQPESETLLFTVSGLETLNDKVELDFLLRTKCFEKPDDDDDPVAEPASLGLVGLVLTGLVRRKRS
jgi:hypothetical protein